MDKFFDTLNVSSFTQGKFKMPLKNSLGFNAKKGRTNNNPTVYEFLKNTQALRVIDSIQVNDITGNCRGTKGKSYDLESVDLEKPLKKRRRQLLS